MDIIWNHFRVAAHSIWTVWIEHIDNIFFLFLWFLRCFGMHFKYKIETFKKKIYYYNLSQKISYVFLCVFMCVQYKNIWKIRMLKLELAFSSGDVYTLWLLIKNKHWNKYSYYQRN